MKIKSGYRPGAMKIDKHLEDLWRQYREAQGTTERCLIYQKIEDHLRLVKPPRLIG